MPRKPSRRLPPLGQTTPTPAADAEARLLSTFARVMAFSFREASERDRNKLTAENVLDQWERLLRALDPAEAGRLLRGLCSAGGLGTWQAADATGPDPVAGPLVAKVVAGVQEFARFGPVRFYTWSRQALDKAEPILRKHENLKTSRANKVKAKQTEKALRIMKKNKCSQKVAAVEVGMKPGTLRTRLTRRKNKLREGSRQGSNP